MWTYNNDYNKWVSTNDSVSKEDFDYLKQELQSTRFYSRCLSGATYLPVNSLENIYDVLNSYQPRNWYISPDPTTGSIYSVTTIPSKYLSPIDKNTYYDYYTKYVSEYGLTLKNLFTPQRLIKDSSKNFYYVDVATTEYIDLSIITPNYVIDGVSLVEGHRVLVKDQKSNVVLLATVDPDTYFTGNYVIAQNLGATIEYQYYNEENGIYLYTNGSLVREPDLDDYNKCIRYSVSVKLGVANSGKQFHLSRLLDGYYPMTSLSQPIEFKEKHNWILRNRVDYNNLFEINYYDVLKHGTQSYSFNGYTYSIPERTVAVGEFGYILNTQEGISNIINNKYKINLRSITETSTNYWVCGDENTLLKIRKHDFQIERILFDELVSKYTQNIKANLYSVSFFNDLNGVAVGELNTIFHTKNGGYTWERIEVLDFVKFNYTKALYTSNSGFFVAGKQGVLLEFKNTIYGWTAYQRRISKIEDELDEYLLVDNINDMYKTSISTWNVTYSYYTQSIPTDKELLFLVTDNNNIIAYDINKSFSEIDADFIYFDFGKDYKDIVNITQKSGADSFYFTGVDPNSGDDGLFSFNINNFQIIGTGSSYSNTAVGLTAATFEYSSYMNSIYDYNGQQILICGNTNLLSFSTYSTPLVFESPDPTFEEKLKSKVLFLDYDVASKLNFFTDDGDYRLPNSVTFSNISFTGSIGFLPIEHPMTSTNNGTYSETNWLTYWCDTQKTFEYFTSTPLDESKTVLISTTFSYYSSSYYGSTSITYYSSEVTSDMTYISHLAPSIQYTNASRFDSGSYSAPTAPPSSSYSIFLYKYLMIYKVPTNYQVSIGDVFKLESDIIDTTLIVNKILTIGTPSFKYIYMFTEFNDNIIKELANITPVSIKITNLNKYTTLDELIERFNSHPISNAYSINYVDSYGDITDSVTDVFQISANFNTLTAYYNLQTSTIIDSVTYSMTYSTAFLNFGYSPTYNIMDYLTSLNVLGDPNPKFYATKEYLALPVYEGLPLDSLTSSTVYFDYNGMTYSSDIHGQPIVDNNVSQGNKILMGTDFKLEWDSIFINTFVDVVIHGLSNTYTTEKLLVIDKYYDSTYDAYVIEFHKRLNFVVGENLVQPGCTLDIKSRRALYQIGQDLQELNNIQRAKSKSNSFLDNGVYSYQSYANELNYKIPTDSYAKVLLSDVDTVEELTALIYVDYKYELAMNVTRLATEFSIPILNTVNYSNKLYITCLEKHGLKTGDGVVLEFNGGTGSSQELNPQYSGYHIVTKINETDILTDIDYGLAPSVGIDSGYVKYIRQDAFLNYQPINLIDLGADVKGKISIELSIDNLELSNDVYSLINVDFEKYVFRLIDGLNVETISVQYPWILEAEISDALIGLNQGELIWYSGTWLCGRWFGGIWESGVWRSGDWYDGTFNSHIVTDNKISAKIDTKTIDYSKSLWYNGRWFGGTWNAGTWNNGRWYAGVWNNGIWYNGIWNDGIWNAGTFNGGIWVLGTWNGGIFNCDIEPAYWIDGNWYGGDFENGMWYDGYWEQKNTLARFGTKSFNSRTATWQSGTWVSGSFYSKLKATNDVLDVCDVHKYSIWKTGKWLSGEWYGGIAYNMDFKIGTWYGGILEDIQIIGVDSASGTFTLNGIFHFNIGDDIYIIDNQIDNIYSVYGSNANFGSYKVLNYIENTDNTTTVYVNDMGSGPSTISNIDTGLRLVSRFKNVNWKSGIWTNGLFDDGLWEGGIWYNGVFKGTWV